MKKITLKQRAILLDQLANKLYLFVTYSSFEKQKEFVATFAKYGESFGGKEEPQEDYEKRNKLAFENLQKALDIK